MSSYDDNDKSECTEIVNDTKRILLDYVAKIDVSLDFMIPYYFLRRQTDIPLFQDSVFDNERWATFGNKISFLGKILKHRFPQYDKRKKVISILDEMRELRNEFAHTISLELTTDEINRRVFFLHKLEDGEVKKTEHSLDLSKELPNKMDFVDQEFENIRKLMADDKLKDK
ncbi:hypothetical protein [Nitrosopumilus sp.]|uniref:hypothetical protein n=1 Tax=Nitrosopumilus sp. TaxID=2024843 RepID=UPI00292E54D9|nr:hypothetical protein [Nitrosopumilus sp.]